MTGCGVTDTQLGCQGAKAELVDAVAGDNLFGGPQHSCAEIAVVIGLEHIAKLTTGNLTVARSCNPTPYPLTVSCHGPPSERMDGSHYMVRFCQPRPELLNGTSADFQFLRDSAGRSDSALSKQLMTLEDAGYIEIRKGFVGKRPRTSARLTSVGRAFDQHVAALQEIVAKAGASVLPST